MASSKKSTEVSINHQDNGEWLETTPGERFTIRTSAKETKGIYTMLEVVADPRNGVPIHIHKNEDEHFLVLEGTLHIVIGDITLDVRAGTAVTVSKGEPHAWCNLTEMPVRMLVIFSPGHIEELFKEVAARKSNNNDDIAALADRFGCLIVGPPLREDIYTIGSPRSSRSPLSELETIMTQTQTISPSVSGNRIFKLAAFLYGIVAYLVFFVAFLYAVGFVTGLVVPKTIDTGRVSSVAEALIVNFLLMTLFAVQHSLMARKQFKQWWTQYVPKPVERSTYVLFASLTLILLFWQWRPMPEILWHIEESEMAMTITAVSFVGWLMVLSSTFLINHFELFGLHQVANNLTGLKSPAPRFRTPLYYNFVRHPIYLGFVIAFWAAPTMSAGHLLFAAVTTAYIFVGIFLEERDLVEMFGDEYRRYKQRVSMLLPWRYLTRG
jgi:protein-S-isoprenylcysteine O-methyltransferase Ste14/mannose-6-phosphate isomerase-like protein (cupin superfamily)